MRYKFGNNQEKNILGEKIQLIRKSKKITQAELGNMVGMSKSGISKIEKGLTHISAEDASVLMDAMGERLEFNVVMNSGAESILQRTRFMSTGTTWFAHERKLSYAAAYKFLLAHKGLDFLEDNYLLEQTYPRRVVVEDLMLVCGRNGGHI